MKKLSAPAAYYRNCRRTRSPSAWILGPHQLLLCSSGFAG